ncbi:MAG: DUF192 domain-containing protein [Flavobacteriales bacterium]|nr:DUF192 domain-containing protein [Flavobacteriales bacterium]
MTHTKNRHSLILAAGLLFMAMVGCNNGADKGTGTDHSGADQTKVHQAGPQFKKEGELWLTHAEGDTIRQLDIEIADIESERTIGLMHRWSMPDTQGMLFIFEEEEPRSFWMHNTLMGLDIIFIREDGTIESIAKYCVPKSDKSIPSKGPSTYVLEVKEGFSDIYGLVPGDKISYVRTDGK